jgi:hypothetical protein
MLIEATLLGLAVLSWKKLGKTAEWTPEHEEMYQNALEHLKGAAGVRRLREIAAECDKQGHHVKASTLRKRADLRDADEKVKAARRQALEKGLSSTNIQGILRLAEAFEAATATSAARALRERAEFLRDPMSSTNGPELLRLAATLESEPSAASLVVALRERAELLRSPRKDASVASEASTPGEERGGAEGAVRLAPKKRKEANGAAAHPPAEEPKVTPDDASA